MKTLILFALILSQTAAAAEETLFSDSARKNKVDFIKAGEVSILCTKSDCLARAITSSTKFLNYKSNWENGENPASGICRHLAGKAAVAYQSDGSEIATCKFTDSSEAIGWDLVRAWRKIKR